MIFAIVAIAMIVMAAALDPLGAVYWKMVEALRPPDGCDANATRKRGKCIMTMDRQEAIEFLVDHYQNPRNRGPLPDADVHLSGGNPGCADTVEMYAKISPDGHVEQVSFEGQGCTISMAAASYVTELTQGMSLDEIEHLSFEALMDDLGREVVMARPTCATVALGTLKKGIHEYHMRKQAEQQ